MTDHRPRAAVALEALSSAIQEALGEELVGLYVYGSYVLGGFDAGGSDLDLVAVLDRDVVEGDLARLRPIHDDLVGRMPAWTNRLDIVYIGRHALEGFRSGQGSFAVISPGESFSFRTDVADWLQSWYLLRETSQSLVGVPAAELVPPITRAEFVAELVESLEDLRGRARGDLAPGFLAYIVLSHCRALMTVRVGTDPSKASGAAWARERMPEWAWLIDGALECRHSGGRHGFDDGETRDAARRFLDVVAEAIDRSVPSRP
jgi:predicted nucleotidyltransferase